MIELDFNQSSLIERLKERGSAIREFNFEKKRLCEARINGDIIRNRAALVRPKVAFITFEHPKAKRLILKEAEKKEIENIGQVRVKKAPLPTNIKWEARNLKGAKVLVK